MRDRIVGDGDKLVVSQHPEQGGEVLTAAGSLAG
jgi:hypothetical protein